MIASEIDLESIRSAEENINRNNLQELIKGKGFIILKF